MVFASRSAETAQALDEECARRGIRLTLSTCHYIGHQLVFPDDWAHRSREDVAAESVLGFIVDRASIGDYMGELLPALARFGRPVSVLMDRPVSDDAPWVHEQHPRVTVTLVQAILDREAGLAVGNYLVARGHRRVAYIGPERHIRWSHDRLAGLVDAMLGADPEAEVAVFPLPEANQPDSRSLVPELTRVLQNTLPHVFAMALGVSSYHETRFLRQVAASSYDYHALLFRTPVWSLRGFEDAARKARRRPELTAWVCGNEKVAVLAHDYLVSAGVRVPGELSLIGIDDVQETLIRRTTMHSFVPRMAVETAINAILKPRLLRQDHEGVHTVRLRGEIRERGSVAALSRPAER